MIIGPAKKSGRKDRLSLPSPPEGRTTFRPFTVLARGPNVTDYSFNGTYASNVVVNDGFSGSQSLVRGSAPRSVDEHAVPSEDWFRFFDIDSWQT